MIHSLITPPEATNTGPGFNRGSGGGARGCGFFKERAYEVELELTQPHIPYGTKASAAG